MADVFFSEGAWRIIPIVTSLVCFYGLHCAWTLRRIAKRNHVRQLDEQLRNVAANLHARATSQVIMLVLLVMAGVLWTVAWLPVAPNTGRFVAAWVNHYLVGGLSVVLTNLARLSLAHRRSLE